MLTPPCLVENPMSLLWLLMKKCMRFHRHHLMRFVTGAPVAVDRALISHLPIKLPTAR